MRLLVRHHLEAMLQATQIAIGCAQIVAHLRADPVVVREAVERLQRLPRTKRPLAAACDELLGLDEKFNFANAAAPELQIVPRDGDLPVPLRGMDLPLHRVNVGDGVIIEIFAPDVRSKRAQEGFSRFDVTGHGARLDHRRALPILAETFVIAEGGLGRDGRLRRARVGPQSQIRAEDVAIGRPLLHDMNEFACKADKKGSCFDTRSEPRDLAVEEDDQVDIA